MNTHPPVTVNPSAGWVVVVNDSTTHGPFSYVDAVVFSERVITVPEITDALVRPVADDDVTLTVHRSRP